MADIGQFEQMILALCNPDNAIRNQAEQALNQAKENPEILLTAMTQLLRTNQNPQVRSMCALLLRKQAMQPGAADASGQASSSLARLSPQARLLCVQHLPRPQPQPWTPVWKPRYQCHHQTRNC